MARQRPPASRLTVCTFGRDVAAIRRVAALLPTANAHAIALRALRAGLPLVERELREAARALVEQERA